MLSFDHGGRTDCAQKLVDLCTKTAEKAGSCKTALKYWERKVLTNKRVHSVTGRQGGIVGWVRAAAPSFEPW